MGSFRFAIVAIGLMLAGCASFPDEASFNGFDDAPPPSAPSMPGPRASIETPAKPMQCVTYARVHSGIELHGDAGRWWDLAAGRYARASAPAVGSVLVLAGYGGPHRGHVAVVTAIDSDREIRVDHANWFGDGRVYRNDPVVDVSPDNDWSAVKVWDTRDNVLGLRTYQVQGFILPQPDTTRLASGD